MLKLLQKVSCSLLVLGLGNAIALSAIAEESYSQTLPVVPEPSGCLTGYPDGTFRGNQPVTRYEFAAGLNACLEGANQQLEGITQNAPTAAEIANFRSSIEQYRQDLDSLNQRLDRLSR